MRARRWRFGALGAVSGCVAAIGLFAATSVASASDSAANFLAPFSASGSGAPRGYTPVGRPAPSGQARYLGNPATAPWLALTHAPPSGFFPGSMNLLTDGSVLVHEDNTGVWKRLVPDAHGSYVNGTWQAVAPLPAGYAPEYYSSQVLPNGQLIVTGGEYNGSNTEVWTTLGAIYNPLTNTWTKFNAPAAYANLGDAQSVVVPTLSGTTYSGGRMVLAHPFGDSKDASSTDAALLNVATTSPTGDTWTTIPATGKLDRNDEEGWNLLANDKVLTVDIEHNWNGVQGGSCSPCTSELFNLATRTWSPSGNIPVDLPSYTGPSGPSEEMGPVITRPTGQAFAIGGNDATATYNEAAGTWTKGPTLPNNLDSADGSASILPDGNVLFDVSPGVFNSPTHFYVWNGTTLTQTSDTVQGPSDSSYVTRLMVLPTGQVLFDDGTGDIEIFNAHQTPNSAWAPTISTVPTTLARGSTQGLTGTQLSGLSTGAAYGDDNQDATNYPLVRITNNATHVVTYARTTSFSYSIKPAAASSTRFTVPASTPTGASTLVVVANGIASAPKAVTIS